MIAIAALVVALHLLALGSLKGPLWGVHFYAFLPPWCWGVGTLAVCGAALALRSAPPRPAVASEAAARPPLPLALSVGLLVACAGFAGALFWGFRIRHILLGDGIPITANLPLGERFHDLEPLTAILQHVLYGSLRGAFALPGRPEFRVAWDAVALGSVLAGMLFVPVAWGLAGEVAPGGANDDGVGLRAATARAASAGTVTPARSLACLIILSQGYAQLFFGYVENYTFYTLALGLYLLASLRFLRGSGSLLPAGAALLLTVAFHLSGGILLPSFAVLILVALLEGARRAAALRDLAVLVALFFALGLMLARIAPGYSIAPTFFDVAARALGHPLDAARAGLFSLGHLRDFANEQLLIGPLGALLFFPALALAALRLRRGSQTAHRAGAMAAFLAIAALAYLGASFLAGDSNLGYARNWDLLAPGGLVLVVASLALLAGPGAASARVFALGLALSLFHTAPWIAVNASEPRSLARFAALPLGLGRTESTLGHWYAIEGRPELAEQWLARSLDRNPGNTRAHVFLGELYLAEGRIALACEAYAAAVSLRPDKEEYHLDYANALALGGRSGDARREIESLMRRHPDLPSLWALDGIALILDGDLEDGGAALEHAAGMSPGDPLLARARARLDQPEGLAKLRDDWLDLTRIARASLP